MKSLHPAATKRDILSTAQVDDNLLLRRALGKKTSYSIFNGLHPQPVPTIDQGRAPLEFADKVTKEFGLAFIIEFLGIASS